MIFSAKYRLTNKYHFILKQLILSIVILSLLSQSLNAKNQSNAKKPFKPFATYQLTYKFYSIPNQIEINYVGAYLDFNFSWIGIYWTILLGEDSKKNQFLHFQPGILIGMLFLGGHSEHSDLYKGFISTLVLLFSEGVNFHIRPFDWLSISPFISYGNYDFNMSDSSKFLDLYSLESGLRISFYPTSGFTFGFYSSYFYEVINNKTGYTMGGHLGTYF